MRASKSIAPFALGIVILGVLACEPVRLEMGAAVHARLGYEPMERRLGETYVTTTYRNAKPSRYPWSYQDQWRTWQEGRTEIAPVPQLCVAMSGGGLRSAAFNIGVLSGLYETTVTDDAGARRSLLDRIDMMSGVSGGSSALAWYLVQHYMHQQDERLAKDDDALRQAMFSMARAPQRYLEDHYTTFTDGEYVTGGVLNTLFAPLNLAGNGVFGLHANTAPTRRWYEAKLRQLFQRDPFDPDGRASRRGEEVSIPDLRDFAARRRLPFFIINTTALIENDLQHLAAQLGNSVFQFTPFDYGSDAFGRHPYDNDAAEHVRKVSRVVSISSAAFDGVTLVSGASEEVLWSLATKTLACTSPTQTWTGSCATPVTGFRFPSTTPETIAVT